MNQLSLVGRLCRDSELKYTQDKRAVINNTIAVGRIFRKENGQDADFIPFVAWGKTAQLIDEYCNKGDLVGLVGRIQSRNYENDKKEMVYVVEMLVQEVHFLQPKKDKSIKDELLGE